jgi:hypothetical protein
MPRDFGNDGIQARCEPLRRHRVDTRFAPNGRSGCCRAAAARSGSARAALDDVKQKQNDHNDDDRDDAAAYVHDSLLYVPPGSRGDHNNCSNSRCWPFSGASIDATSASEPRTLSTTIRSATVAHRARRSAGGLLRTLTDRHATCQVVTVIAAGVTDPAPTCTMPADTLRPPSPRVRMEVATSDCALNLIADPAIFRPLGRNPRHEQRTLIASEMAREPPDGVEL